MTCLLNAENLEPELLSPRSNEPGDTLSVCVCAVKPYFYNIQQFEQLARGLRTRQPVKLVPDRQILLA